MIVVNEGKGGCWKVGDGIGVGNGETVSEGVGLGVGLNVPTNQGKGAKQLEQAANTR